MTRNDRARQFLPFDSLKGLKESLLLADYEHEAETISDLSEDEIEKISSYMKNHKKSDIVNLSYKEGRHVLKYKGQVKIDIAYQILYFDKKSIHFSQIRGLEKAE